MEVAPRSAGDTTHAAAARAAARHTARVERLYALLRERMTRAQKTWGRLPTVLDDPDVERAPLVVRHARALTTTTSWRKD